MSSDEEDDKGFKVYLRLKPRNCRTEEKEMLQVRNKSTLLLKSTKDPDIEYKFTKIFGPRTDQDTIFEECVLPSIKGFVSGQNCLLFAYGASSAGKTYTLQGTPDNPGIIPRAISAVFNYIKDRKNAGCQFKPHLASSVLEMDENAVRRELAYKQNLLSGLQRNDSTRSIRTCSSYTQESTFSTRSDFAISSTTSSLDVPPSFGPLDGGEVAFSIWVSFIEIYNEQIFDLLVPPSDRKRRPLILEQDSAGDVYLKDLQHVWVNSAEEAYQMLLCGQQNLNYASTNLNAASSHSHYVFSLNLICEFKDLQKFHWRRFSFCDLAGTERAKKTENVGDCLKESHKIDTSLHFLGMCLRIIRDNQNSKKKSMIPFHDCKLTRLFQNALLGREAIRMIVNVSLDPYLYDETSQVLKFSPIAKKVVLQQRRPYVLHKESRFSRYINKIYNTSKFSSVTRNDSYAQKRTKVSLLNQRIEELVNEVCLLKLQLDAEKKDKIKLERRIRADTADRYRKILEETERMYQSRLEDAQLHYLEKEQRRCNKMKQYIHTISKKRKRDSDEDSQEEEEDLEEQIESLSMELKSVKELLESQKLQSEELLQQNTNLQFQLSDVTEKLKIATMACAAEDSDSNENIVSELIDELNEKTEELKMNKIDIEELHGVIKDAKIDYEQLEVSHNVVVKTLEELERKFEDKTSDLRDAEHKLNICHKQLDSLYDIQYSKDEEIELLRTKSQKDAEAKIEEVANANKCLRKKADEALLLKEDLEEKLSVMEKNYEKTTAALEKQQDLMKQQKIVTDLEIENLKAQLQSYKSGVSKMKQELNQIHAKYQDAEKKNEMLINELKEKELEMKNFTANRDMIFKKYEEKLMKEKQSNEIDKIEIQRLRLNERVYENKLQLLSKELEQKDEELKICYAKLKAEDKHVSQRQGRMVVADNLHPSQWVVIDPKTPVTKPSTSWGAACGISNTKAKKEDCKAENKGSARKEQVFFTEKKNFPQ